LQQLQDLGFSAAMIDRFFRPFLGGIFLEADLQTSSRMFEFVFRMFALGDACLPDRGMEAIPQQLAAGLPAGKIQLGTRVIEVQGGSLRLESRETLQTRAIVVAVEGPTAAELLGQAKPPSGQGVTCLYFAAEQPPVQEPVLVLNGEGQGPVNNFCVPSMVAPSYAPPGQHLVSATVLGIPERDDAGLQADVLQQMAGWFGPVVKSWRHLRTYRIPYALPRQVPPALSPPEREVRRQPSVFVCGDHCDNASIQGAMVSGGRAAEAVLRDLA